jgi:hypothetical protein
LLYFLQRPSIPRLHDTRTVSICVFLWHFTEFLDKDWNSHRDKNKGGDALAYDTVYIPMCLCGYRGIS